VVRNRQAALQEAALEQQRVEAAVQRATARRLDDLNKTMVAAQLLQATLLSQVRHQKESLERQAALEHERARIAEELAEMRHDFVAGASHELRTPLTAILGYSELLEQRWDVMEEPQRRQTLRRIVTSVNRQLRLVEDLLLVSRVETDGVSLRFAEAPLGDLVRRAADEVRASYPGQPITLQGPEELLVQGDADRIVQVLVNLMDNAAKYSPEGSPIAVSWQGHATEARVGVRDFGGGISAQDRARLFTRFGRVPGSRTRAGRTGTGLGLYLSRLLAEAMRGTLDLEQSSAEGSIFRLDLPRANKAEGVG
jgi:signal transduction histidine kinase